MSRAKKKRRARRAFGTTRRYGVEEKCSKMARGTRGVLGTVGGAAIGALGVLGTFWIAMTKDRQLQKAAGAPAPKPGLATGIAGAVAAVGGGVLGNRLAMRRPQC
jgi:hypothetical protein